MAKTNQFGFKAPDDSSTKLWRYMPLSAFEWMLRFDALFIPKVTTLMEQDKFEGSVPISLFSELTQRAIERAKESENPRESLYAMLHALDRIRTGTLNSPVSCWHCQDHEQFSMWQIYGQSSASVAIVTSFEELIDFFDDRFVIGKVEYIDSFAPREVSEGEMELPDARLLSMKMQEYKYEEEIRAIIPASLSLLGIEAPEVEVDSPAGKNYPIGDWGFIREIYVHPSCPPHIFELVKNSCERKSLCEPGFSRMRDGFHGLEFARAFDSPLGEMSLRAAFEDGEEE